MTEPYYEDELATVYNGDCIEVMKELPENSVDAIVTDPPYGLEFMGKEWDKLGTGRKGNPFDPQDIHITNRKVGTWQPGSVYGAPKKMPKCSLCGKWKYNASKASECHCETPKFETDTWSYPYKMQQFHQQWAEQALRVLKPGGYLLAFGGTRTSHRLVCGIEDAGFEIRDTIMWVYGSGFPKSLDISKQIDKIAGAEREVTGQESCGTYKSLSRIRTEQGYRTNPTKAIGLIDITTPSTPDAKEWQGWGTALKPAWEIIIAAQKPLTTEGERGIITVNLNRLEAKLWSLLSVNVAEENFKLSPNEYAEVCDFAQWNADEKSNIQESLHAQMDMSQFASVINTSLSIVQLWKSTWVDILKLGNTYITETELNQTIDLKTLNSLLFRATPLNLIQAVILADGIKPNALPVGQYLHAVLSKLHYTLTLSVIANATSKESDLSLHPNAEPICVARKPLAEKNVASNVLKWGTGGIDIDGSRVNHNDNDLQCQTGHKGQPFGSREHEITPREYTTQGRFPSNVILECTCEGDTHTDPNCPCYMLDEQSITMGIHGAGNVRSSEIRVNSHKHTFTGEMGTNYKRFGDNGGASRFFYVAKASRKDRGNGNTHPTCKPSRLMEYLIKMVSRQGAVILDPFMGSGTTMLACIATGRKCIGIEQSLEYCEIIKSRYKQVQLV